MSSYRVSVFTYSVFYVTFLQKMFVLTYVLVIYKVIVVVSFQFPLTKYYWLKYS